MTVYFIGAGPGAPDLLTLRGADLLARCTVCLYAGSLVPQEMLDRCPPGARLVDTARMPLPDIVGELVAAHAAGLDVARLHSGDISLYSAFTEQAGRLDAAGVPYEIVPGVPAFAAAAASLRRELTVPGVGQSLLVTRVSTLSTDMPPGEDLTSLARTGVTLALHLAAHRAQAIADELTPHYGADCPVAVVAFASRPDERVVRCTLADLPRRLAEEGITKTAVIFVGKVLAPAEFEESYLYSARRLRVPGASH
ncbi:precorrin-4 C(11)-methyltransferase [Tsukamurella pseudospumae]|uniref:Precorrin-4 C(11)-methyltransferase n=1 Tax=Tsukamurella pseudospumae TaxID=239498 RepID=A0A138AWZ6_9ACTN|nr:precorrin-4 C(11)-methyltransferase [Tsukamurella pseudospumae]KXP01335.1 precorrin-4 C(11)-methyltransferase [Tsukamurella pseudospumae]KXP14988.1 precorrin-4 C(11)-methyltransferase [Tsukamurella pseudospumae]